jgi:putative endonuclease
MRTGYVYILASNSRVLYIGVTNDLEHRVRQHQSKEIPGFTRRYNVTRLIWFEAFPDTTPAIAWEKKLKGWTRAKKVRLIEETNPRWDDLAASIDASPVGTKMLRSAQHDGVQPCGARCHPERSEGSSLGAGTHTRT